MKAIYAFLFVCFCLNNAVAQNSGNLEDDKRPCPNNDIRCIRKFFEEHSYCSAKLVSEGPKEVIRRRSVAYLPVTNITVTLDNVKYKNLNARINDFFIDRINDKVVLVITFKDLSLGTDHARLSFSRKGKEPVITKGTFFAAHGPIVVTASIPTVNKIKLQDAITFAFIEEPLPRKLELSPSLFRTKDPEAKLASVEFFKRVNTEMIEFFTTETPFIFAVFVQHAICDFGLTIL